MIIKNPSRIEYIDNEGVVSKVIYSTKHFSDSVQLEHKLRS